jgi:hypothetical protein
MDSRLSSHGGAHVEQLRGKSQYPGNQKHIFSASTAGQAV